MKDRNITDVRFRHMFGISAYIWDFSICFGFRHMFRLLTLVSDFSISFRFGISASVSADMRRKLKYFGTGQMNFGTQV